MRAIITFAALVFAATVTIGQDEVQPSARPADPLCEYAFSQASAAPATSGSLDATAAPSSGSLRHPITDATTLDDAIRMCASLDDFAAAVARHPDVLGSTDAMVFLKARCEDPASDLARFVTCASLERALATPVPTLEPTPSLSPRPEPTALPRAAATPRAPRSPRQTPRPADRPATRIVPKPGTRLTRVPRGYRASVPGATRVQYFSVKGSTPRQLMQSMTRAAEKHCGPHTAACVRTGFSASATYIQDPSAGTCTLTGVSVPMSFVAHIPRWTRPRQVPTYMVWWWKKAAARIGWHEAQHVRIAEQYAARLSRMVAGKPCARYPRIFKRWARDLREVQKDFDMRDYPRNDRALSRWWHEAFTRYLQ